jgi:hypothetical protein
MKNLQDIQEKVLQNAFEFSEHAVYQSITRNISVQEVREAFQTAELLEDYPEDKYGPSLLLLGFTNTQRPLHIQCSYPTRPLIKIITLYQPDPKKWLNHRIRR